MNYTKYEVGPYNLHVINTDKFKTTTIRLNFKKKVKKEDVTYLTVLNSMLFKSTKKYKTNKDLEIASENLYDITYGDGLTISGNYIIMHIYGTFLNEKYSDSEVLEKSIEFLSEILFNPDVIDKKFNEEKLNEVKKEIRDEIITYFDNPSVLGKQRLFEIMDPDSSLSYSDYGTLDDLEKITPESLYKYYVEFLKTSIVDIYACGSFDNTKLKEYIMKYVKVNTIKRKGISHEVIQTKIRRRSRSFKEEKDIEQSKLFIGCKIEKMTSDEKEYTSYIYNYILGGGTGSLLFNDVREKHSLCYYINSRVINIYNIMYITSGIDTTNYRKAVSLIKKNIKKISDGKFDSKLIDEAKKFYKSGCKMIKNNPYDIIASYMSMNYFNRDDIEVRMKQIDKVTKGDIINFSKKIHLDTILLVEGSDKDA